MTTRPQMQVTDAGTTPAKQASTVSFQSTSHQGTSFKQIDNIYIDDSTFTIQNNTITVITVSRFPCDTTLIDSTEDRPRSLASLQEG
jgi:hypothetical protein